LKEQGGNIPDFPLKKKYNYTTWRIMQATAIKKEKRICSMKERKEKKKRNLSKFVQK